MEQILDLETLKTPQLRTKWTELFARPCPLRMGRTMMIKSIGFKQREQDKRGLSPEHQKRLESLVRQYRRNPHMFDQKRILKPGTRLVRQNNGNKHIVTVLEDGFEYNEQQWSSLSKIAKHITGKSWNGWVFFGIK